MAARLYLAGPDVFHPDAHALGAAKKALCASYGFEGLFPLDTTIPPGSPPALSRAIYESCVAMMDHADAGLFNLTPFRGPSADVGTVFELGHMAAHGKPTFAYTNAAGTLIDRLRLRGPLTKDRDRWRDADGYEAEDFGNVDNLMIDETLAAQGRSVHRGASDQTFTSLGTFRAALEEAAAWFELPKP